MTVQVRRLPIRLEPDSSRVITRFFDPGGEARTRAILARLLAIPEDTVATLLAKLEQDFQPAKPSIDQVFCEHYAAVKQYVSSPGPLSEARQKLIGASFTMQYAVESAALFNPSMVPAVDQSDVISGSVRFLMSLRATGEGHVSSVVFRLGLVDSAGNVTVDPPGRYCWPAPATPPGQFDKREFVRQLQALNEWIPHAQAVMSRLGDRFTESELSDAIEAVRKQSPPTAGQDASDEALLALTRASYRLPLPAGKRLETDISEAVVFPHSPDEQGGIEDLRLVRFTGDAGSVRYYGTYTAYNGYRTFPHLLEYQTGQDVDIHLLTGRSARNKGMALFPRMIHGRYAMVARLDSENLYYMESDDVLVWDEARFLRAPTFAWEVIQIGNCGSPIETEVGWLLLTHGVGPMRQYCIGAVLLDLHDPSQVIGETAEPLLIPTGSERLGYVPNVVYSCGGMIHAGKLILPYAMSDLATSIAVIDLQELLDALVE